MFQRTMCTRLRPWMGSEVQANCLMLISFTITVVRPLAVEICSLEVPLNT